MAELTAFERFHFLEEKEGKYYIFATVFSLGLMVGTTSIMGLIFIIIIQKVAVVGSGCSLATEIF